MLLPIERFPWNRAIQRGPEQHFRFSPGELPPGGECEQILDQLMIEQRRAHLQRMRHAHPVHFGQHVVGQGGLQIDVEDPAQGIRSGGPPEGVFEHCERVCGGGLRP